MPHKLAPRVELKDADKGTFVALFSRFNVLDKDGDVTFPGAFEDGKRIPVSAYGHQSWQGKLPVGTAQIKQTDSEAQAHGRFLLDTTHGHDTWATLKGMHEAGVPSEWSYGYDVTDYDRGDWEGKSARFLKRLVTHEVSPTLQGAGVQTTTLDIKSRKSGDGGTVHSGYSGAIRPHETDTVDEQWAQSVLLKTLSVDASIAELRAVHAWVDPTGDPERQVSYGYAHHGAPDGAANVRACLLGIAALNGTKGAGMNAEARRVVYDHLAYHLRDAGRYVPELRKPGDDVKLADRTLTVLADVTALVDAYEEVGASRALKGKTLTASSLEALAWVEEALSRMRTMLDSPQEMVAREMLRHIARTRVTGM